MVEISVVSDDEEEEASSSSPARDQYQYLRNRWKYDVFLSFRGEDTRKTFVDHLYSALVRSGIYTFKDDERLERGESISPALLKAIGESMFAVIVFSKNYASSSWCLDELVKIMECSKSPMGQTLLPIFYDVQPSEVRKQEGYFGKLFGKLDSDKVKIWKEALRDAANISGWELKNTADGSESKFIELIVEEIRSKLRRKIASEDEGLVGMKPRIEKVTLLLGAESDVVRAVGIWGLSGIGKSTLARAVFNQIQYQFEGACFIENVGEVTSKEGGLERLQKKLLSTVLKVKRFRIMNAREGTELMKRMLRSRRVLLVLDDVNRKEQLQALAGSHEWFCPGSRIIITTKNRRLLLEHRVEKIYKVSVLKDVEATKLFRWHAFKENCPTKDFEELSDQVIKYAGGLPLALEVLGSALYNRDVAFWKASLEKLGSVGPHDDIIEKLKIGYDGLEETVQNTFLDVACFFEGRWKEDITRKLNGFGFSSDTSIPLLAERSLVYYSCGRVCMHQLIREMGRHIVRKNFCPEPWKHSRLWDPEEIEFVLENSWGTENIEGIMLDPRKCIRLDTSERERIIEMGTEAFRRTTNLRLLEIHNACIRKGPEYLPDGLRWIDWDKYPSKSLPTTFEAIMLVGLQLRHSSIEQLWVGGKKKKKLHKLRYVDLSDSRNLVGTSHLGEAPNLEKLILRGCTSLVELDQSIGSLRNLVCLNLIGCEKLRSLPETIHWKALEFINLYGCFQLQKFPEIPENMEKLSKLDLVGTAVSELPLSIGNIPNLISINLSHCKNLVTLPSTLCTLIRLKSLVLFGCSKLEKLPEELGNLEFSLEELLLNGTAITQTPRSITRLSKLKIVSVLGCKGPIPYWLHWWNHQNPMDLVLPSVSGLERLQYLCIHNRNLSDGIIHSDLGSLRSLMLLDLSMNNFLKLQSLSRLPRLKCLVLNHCKWLQALPELPSSVEVLNADGCTSLRVSVDQLNKGKMECVRFLNCMQLYGECEIIASTLWQKKLQGRPDRSSWDARNIILPGSEIPEWFSNHTFTDHSGFLMLPQNWYCNNRTRFKGYGCCVVLEVINNIQPRGELVLVELSFAEPGHHHPFHTRLCFVGETDNIIGTQHVLLGYYNIDSINPCTDCRWRESGGLEVGITSIGPNAAVVKKWGIRPVYEDDDEDDDDIPNPNQTIIEDRGSYEAVVKKWGYAPYMMMLMMMLMMVMMIMIYPTQTR